MGEDRDSRDGIGGETRRNGLPGTRPADDGWRSARGRCAAERAAERDEEDPERWDGMS